ncbi:hypothetical protein EXN25_10990 [Clostridium botulinum]|uniref:hypothetical protein n=1 Tax=Clostridium botulinum TaxID=1491 RepID=UPI00099D6CC6|nr:hypothetical protein [Clostridium botulinum]NFK37590.1 hypothetical protein [Clostridium botulinum H04402 065]NFB18516.1 hypothetical protein [Clostridium botulinum]NFB66526.1 hypothetical protein [Clostridium botulinum]NFB98983.1 hypothetical protein [Clostridium botulinum]NFC57135.1 hypothetical protein [Clostridium botulinum]
MNKGKNKFIILGIIIVVLLGVFSYNQYQKKAKFIGTPLEPIYKIVKIQNFKEGTYEEYKELFANPNKAITKEQFEAYRNSNKSNDMFKYDGDSIKGIMKHMKSEEKGTDLYKVYYLKNVKDDNEKKDANYWMVVKENNKWIIKN